MCFDVSSLTFVIVEGANPVAENNRISTLLSLFYKMSPEKGTGPRSRAVEGHTCGEES